eukprot:1980890-Rhodomonas_salina.2
MYDLWTSRTGEAYRTEGGEAGGPANAGESKREAAALLFGEISAGAFVAEFGTGMAALSTFAGRACCFQEEIVPAASGSELSSSEQLVSQLESLDGGYPSRMTWYHQNSNSRLDRYIVRFLSFFAQKSPFCQGEADFRHLRVPGYPGTGLVASSVPGVLKGNLPNYKL